MASTATRSSNLMQLDQVFRRFDKDGDGKISAGELIHCMAAVGEEAVTLAEAEAEALVASVDSDGDGMLNLEEFAKLVEAEGEEERSRDLRAAFELYESEAEKGCITPKSLKRMLSRLGSPADFDACRAMICRFDLDGDGVISFEEFRAMMVAS